MILVNENDAILKETQPTYTFEGDLNERKVLTIMMLTFMDQAHGMGLAAPQVGLRQRFFVMHTTDGETRACFNPEIVSISDDSEKGVEGCLSFPDLWLKVMRPLTVEAKYQDVSGNLVYETFENLNARCYLHETDHLNGVRFVDLVGSVSLMTARNKAKKARR
jgi:peptide deformylase